jgi:hypothetical protein
MKIPYSKEVAEEEVMQLVEVIAAAPCSGPRVLFSHETPLFAQAAFFFLFEAERGLEAQLPSASQTMIYQATMKV